jgi:hypothetical protein
MTDETTQRPVTVYYDDDVAPDELHPSGMLAGSTFESPTPEVAKQFHPKARILRYADGGEFSVRKSNAEIREANAPKTVESEPTKARTTRSRASGSSRTRRTASKAQNDVAPENAPDEANTGVTNFDEMAERAAREVAKQETDD